jgi:hypothetical protein
MSTEIDQDMFNLGLSIGIRGNYEGDNGTKFSGDVSFSYKKKLLSTGNYVVANNQIAIGLWQANIGPLAPLTDLVQASILNLALYQSTDKLQPMIFLDTHGTHFVSGVMVGGIIGQTTNIEKSSKKPIFIRSFLFFVLVLFL